MTDWTIYNNLLPWCALTVEQMRAFEASEGEMIWLTSDGGWHPINPPVAPGWIIRVAELAIEDLIEEHEKRALVPQPEADLETCPNCEGTGIAGHPDSGYTCTKCSGCGGVQPEADLVKAGALAAGRAQGIEAAAKVASGWLAAFQGVEIQRTSAREYACDAVMDIADGIRALVPPVDAHKTPVHDRQAGLSLTDFQSDSAAFVFNPLDGKRGADIPKTNRETGKLHVFPAGPICGPLNRWRVQLTQDGSCATY